MHPEAYASFTRELSSRLAADPRVVGLVALGSMAGGSPGPDAFSDHDFFVVTAPGEQEAFRTGLSWLPPRGAIALAHRETAHGLKVVYDDGHLLELAVFDLAELSVARVNRYAVLLDRGGVAERMAEVATRREPPRDDAWLAGQLLGNLLVGGGRARRGELLSARLFVGAHAASCLLLLLARHVPSDGPRLLDDLDPFRRFERVYPELGRELGRALSRPPLEAALALLGLAERELASRVPEWPAAGASAVRRRLEELRSTEG